VSTRLECLSVTGRSSELTVGLVHVTVTLSAQKVSNSVIK
jgi:hypothetical protein